MIASVGKASSIDSGIPGLAFLTAFVFALLASGSLLCERLAEGRLALGWLCSIAVTGGAVLLVVTANAVARPSATLILRAQVCGIVVALALVHVAVFAASRGGRLMEGPAQWVNDAVLIVTTLGFVWSFVCPRPLLRSLLPVVSFALLLGYAATMSTWHVDAFPGLPVQHFVLGQAASTSASLLVFFFAAGG